MLENPDHGGDLLNPYAPPSYSQLTAAEKNRVISSMKIYNGSSLDETFLDPAVFYHIVFRSRGVF